MAAFSFFVTSLTVKPQRILELVSNGIVGVYAVERDFLHLSMTGDLDLQLVVTDMYRGKDG